METFPARFISPLLKIPKFCALFVGAIVFSFVLQYAVIAAEFPDNDVGEFKVNSLIKHDEDCLSSQGRFETETSTLENSFRDDTPLLHVEQEEDNSLLSYVDRFTIKNEKIEESNCAKRVRFGIKVATVLYGATGGIPYISACCNAAQGIMFLCVSFAGGNVVASGAATIWAGLRIAEYFDPVSKEESDTTHSKLSGRLAKHITCNILGILASIPGTYSVYKYNTDSMKFLVVPGFLNNYIFSTSGYYEITNPNSMFQQLLSKFTKKDPVVNASNKIKAGLENQIQNHVIPSLIQNIRFECDLFEEDVACSKIDLVKKFISKSATLKYPPNIIEPPEKWKRGCPRKTSQGVSLVLPLCGALVNYYLGYESARLLVESPVVCNIFAVMVIIPNFMLDVLSSTATTASIFDVVYNKVRNRHSGSFMSSFYPVFSKVIPFLSITLASLSVTGGLVVSRDAVANSVFKDLINVLPAAVFISNAISQSFQMRDLIYDGLNYYSTFRKDGVGETVRKVNRLERLISVVSNSIPSVLLNFWNTLGIITFMGEETET